jgi:hypothetical protein
MEGWSGKPNQLPTERIKDDDGDTKMYTQKTEDEFPSPSASVASMANEADAQPAELGVPPAIIEAATVTAPANIMMASNECPSSAPTALATTVGTDAIASAPTPQRKIYGKGSNRSTTVASFRMKLQVKRNATEWTNGISSNTSFVATTFLNYYLGLAKDIMAISLRSSHSMKATISSLSQ